MRRNNNLIQIIPEEIMSEPEKDNIYVDTLKKYFVETSIHGLKYIYESKRRVVERLFWLISVIIMTISAAFLIYEVTYDMIDGLICPVNRYSTVF